MAYMRLLCGLISISPFILTRGDDGAKLPPLELNTVDEFGTSCTTVMDSCSLKLADGSLSLPKGPPGDKGDKGDRGILGFGERGSRGPQGDPGKTGPSGSAGAQGSKGERGPQGVRGDSGQKGDKGRDGRPGEKGDQGIPGLQGVAGTNGSKGAKGEIGFTGPLGLPGNDGLKGERGEKGPQGPHGPPGLPGMAGSCHCKFKDGSSASTDSGEDEEDFDSEEEPSEVVCKAAPNLENDKPFYMGPGPIPVTCQERGGEKFTCVRQNRTFIKMEYITDGEEPYWLSSKGLTVENLYGINHMQIAWIQEQSNSAFQRLRYHCQNSTPFELSDPERSTLLLSWNDVRFGPTPSEHTPFVYTIPTETDYCSKGGSSSIIEIKSDSAQRLPVVDFLVRDVQKKHSVAVEHLELCFN